MYTISSALKTALDTGRKNIKVIHGSTPLTVQHVTYRANMGDRLTLGAVNAASVTVRAFGRLALSGETITVSLEADGNAGSVPLGSFVVDTCETVSNITTLTAYDAVWATLGGDYVPNATTPPTTALGVLGDVATQTGLSLASTTGITDVTLDGALTGYTYREIVGHMAAVLGRNAYINRTGELALRGYTVNGQALGPSNYYAGGLKLGEAQTLTGVRMVRKETTTTTDADGITTETETTTTYTAGAGTGVVIEIDNPFATQSITTAVWAALSAAVSTYRLGTCEFYGGYDVDPGDLLMVTDTGANTCVFPVMGVTLELDGGCRASISASGRTVTEYSGPVARMLSKIEADLGAFRDLTTENFAAAVAKINNLYADQAWVANLFAQYIRAASLEITGASRFGGIIDGAFAEIGNVSIGSFAVTLTRTDSIYIDPEDWPEPEPGEPPEVVIYSNISEHAAGAPAGKTLMKVGFVASGSSPPRTGEAINFGFTIGTGSQQERWEIRFDEIVNFEIECQVLNDQFYSDGDFQWTLTPERCMIGCTVSMRFYYGERGALEATQEISTGTQFVEAGTPLAQKYADIAHDHAGVYLPLSGGTMSGALNLANNTWNRIGDDAELGDLNVGGCVGLHGLTGNTGLYLIPYSGDIGQIISINGSGRMTITGDLSVAGTITCGTPPLERVRHSVTLETTAGRPGPFQWTIDVTRAGYTPISWSGPIHGNSTTIKVGVEIVTYQGSRFNAIGFVNISGGSSITISMDVLWLKNN